MTDSPLLLVIATGLRPYREYLLRSIGERFRVHLFHVAEPTWERAHIAGFTVLPDTWDGPAMAAAASELAEREPIDGVLCWDEGRIHAASHVARALGLRGGDPDVVWRVRDKGQTRVALAAAGVPQPRSARARTLDDAVAAARVVGYPAILKPRAYGASVGVVRVDDEAQLRERFAFTHDTRLPDPVTYEGDAPVLVEECVLGEEISVDAVVRDGVVTPLYVARKRVGYPPYAEEIGHVVDARDPLLHDASLLAELQATHDAVGWRDGWTHTEFMLTADGPKLIEVNGRLGGDMIPYLGLLATGVDPGVVAASAACGVEADVRQRTSRVAGIRFCYVDEVTTIRSVSFDESALPAAIESAVAVATPGMVAMPPPGGTVWGRVAFVIAVADSAAECEDALDAGVAALRVDGEAGRPAPA